MERVDYNVFENFIANHLDGRDAARLRRCSRTCRKLVDRCASLRRKMLIHYVYLQDVSDLVDEFEGELSRGYNLRDNITCPRVEGSLLTRDVKSKVFYWVSNHYEEHSHYGDTRWDDFANDNPHLLWWCIEYPPLRGTGRFKLGEVSFHRGGCFKIYRGAFV